MTDDNHNDYYNDDDDALTFHALAFYVSPDLQPKTLAYLHPKNPDDSIDIISKWHLYSLIATSLLSLALIPKKTNLVFEE